MRTIYFTFQLFDDGDKGYITLEELSEILLKAFGMDDIDVEKLFHEVDTNEDDKITFGKI
jgi:Ca2+-binding EF-hand superfamily protein